jgi:hypothetical protein
MKKILKPKGAIITSFNEVDRSNDPDRIFYMMSSRRETSLLSMEGYDITESEEMVDASGRFDWITNRYVLK